MSTTQGKAEAEIDGIVYTYQYTIENETPDGFDLTVWHNGQSITEKRCPRYTDSAEHDARIPHGPCLLAQLLEGRVTDFLFEQMHDS